MHFMHNPMIKQRLMLPPSFSIKGGVKSQKNEKEGKMTTKQLGIVFGQYVLGDNNKAAAVARGLPPVITVQGTIDDEFKRDDILVKGVDSAGKTHILSTGIDLPLYELNQ